MWSISRCGQLMGCDRFCQVDFAEGTEGLRDGGSMTDKDSVLDSVLEEDGVVFGDGEC